jgi:hypothetical protein
MENHVGSHLPDDPLERVLVTDICLMKESIRRKPLAAATDEIVHYLDSRSRRDEAVNQMTADESRAADDQDACTHSTITTVLAGGPNEVFGSKSEDRSRDLPRNARPLRRPRHKA